MPIYEYRCAGCHRPSTALLPAWNSPDPGCPHCGAKGLARQVSTFATHRSESGDDFGGEFGGGDEFGGGEDDSGGGGDDYGDDF